MCMLHGLSTYVAISTNEGIPFSLICSGEALYLVLHIPKALLASFSSILNSQIRPLQFSKSLNTSGL